MPPEQQVRLEDFEPESKYAQALAFAFPFFLGVAIMWLAIQADLNRQEAQAFDFTKSEFQLFLDGAEDELQFKVSGIDRVIDGLTSRSDIVGRPDERWLAEVSAALKKAFPLANMRPAWLTVDGQPRARGGIDDTDLQAIRSVVLGGLSRSKKGFVVVAISSSNGSKQPRVLYAKRLSLAEADSPGILAAVIDANYFAIQERSPYLQGSTRSLVLDAKGRLIWHSQHPVYASLAPDLKSKEIEEFFSFFQAMMQGYSPRLPAYRSPVTKDEQLFYWKRLEDQNLYVFVSKSREDVLKAYHELRKRYVLVGFSLTALLVASLYWFFAFRYSAERSDVRQRRDLALLKLSERALEESRQSFRELAAHQIKLKEDERKKIALEIHDELGQRLTALRLEVAMLERLRGSELGTASRDGLALVKEHIDQIIQVVRTVATRLRPATLDIGLATAVLNLADEFRKATNVSIELDIQLPEKFDLEDAAKVAVFRIFQESLTNIVRHAQAQRVRVSLALAEGQLRMTVEDNGQGIDLGQLSASRSLGVSGMRERAASVGGSLDIKSEPGRGTSINVIVPLAPQAASASLGFFTPESRLSHLRSE